MIRDFKNPRVGTSTLPASGSRTLLGLGLLASSLICAPVQAETKFVIPSSSISASTSDTRCDCVAANVLDGKTSTRWSAYGDGAYITFDLGSLQQVSYVKIAWYKGNERASMFDVLVADSVEGPWTNVLGGQTSSGTSTSLEKYDFPDSSARYVRIVGHGNASGNGWNSITEAQVFGSAVAQVAIPAFTPPGGSYSSPEWVSMATATSGTEIRYTTDGSTPSSTSGTPYTGPVSIAKSLMLKAVAYKSGVSNSTVASHSYTIGAAAINPPAGLNPSLPPSSNFDLSKWYITLPNASTVSVSNLNKGYTLSNTFYTDPVTGGMVFRCPNIGGTTTNSSFSRTELREMLNESAGTKELGNNWVLGSSSPTAKAAAGGVDGIMKATLTVDRVSTTGDASKVGRVVVGQIHGPDTEIIRLYYHKRPGDAKGAIYFGHDTPSNSNSYYPIIGAPDKLNPSNGIALGERWDYEIKVVGRTMTVNVTPEGRPMVTTTFAIESGYDDLYLYYKAGVYNQNNTGDASDYVQATFYSLTHTHP